jgi:hypothetical protein
MISLNHTLRIAFLLFVCFSTFVSSHGQTSITTQLGNIIATFNNKGMLFFNQDFNTAGFEVPAGGGVSTIFCSNLWIGGLDDTLGLHTAASRFGYANNSDSISTEYTPGPLTLNGTTNDDLINSYNHIFLANRADIENHIGYFNALQNGTVDVLYPNGYSTPQWMLDWPVWQPDTLCGGSAPFIDTDVDGLYEPQNGDYPCFKGDQCAYIIFNDNGGYHSESEGTPLKATIHLMLYAYTGLGNDIANTLFANYTLFNCSNTNYQETYIGNWTDFDIGFANDDYIGSHVGGGFYYAYNGDNFDETGLGSLGYGANTPVQSVIFLQGPRLNQDGEDNLLPAELSSFSSYGPYGNGHGDGVIDNEHLGMTGFVYYNNSSNPINGEPRFSQHYYNYMRSTWKNGQQLKFGGNGVSGSGVISDMQARYMFPGTSDPYNINTNGVTPPAASLPWSELNAQGSTGNAPSDRRGIAASGPFTFAAGDTISFDLAFQYSEESGTLLNKVTLAYINSIQARELFNASALNCNQSEIILSSNDYSNQATTVRVFPNPASDYVRITGLIDRSKCYTLTDISGREVRNGSLQQSDYINLERIVPGEYILRISDNNGNTIAVRRIQKID